MTDFLFAVTDPVGIHARPAGLLVNLATKFTSDITITKGDDVADAKGIFSIMALGIKNGDEIKVSINGDDEQEALMQIQELLKTKF
ncbi:MAG: HPr family phosphocarrier protein [Oscillospiraceae bacterium]